ncbi:hypothetical protein KP509_08G067000 [Ceratopteris richardii]|uniref:Protein arginine N-methyltransferase domain-containing protein n=1 Tax=Ceratopteris richardii TaxID=49495 RepID=A0A8T2UBA2_CERRI|nr:hypothetical protein KP509_08G067000 [Ceratopteris richardii]
MKSSTILHQRIDPLSGRSEWVIVREAEDVGGLRDSLAHTSYLDMLNDHHRNRAFEAAISNALQTHPGVVLDIGAGTGLLSMMASRALQQCLVPLSNPESDQSIIACEGFLPMYLLAKKVLHLNGLSSAIKLVHKRSEDLKVGIDMDAPADVLLVQCNELWRMRDLFHTESQLKDGLVLHPLATCQNMQHTIHVNALADSIEVITEPFKVFNFDFSKIPPSEGKSDIFVKAIKSGVAHAIISWWVLELDQEGTEVYTTAPKWVEPHYESWHDHWKPCVWFVPTEGLRIANDESIQFSALHDQISFKYVFDKEKKSVETADLKSWVPLMRPERIGLLGSSKWRSTVLDSMKKIFHQESTYTCLVVDDSLPLTIAAAAMSTSASVFSILSGLQEIDSTCLQNMVNGSYSKPGQLRVIRKRCNELTLDDIDGRKVNVLLGEPYYIAYQDMLPWRNLRFWRERTSLASLLDEKAIIVPYRGILCGMAMTMHDLWKSRQALKFVQGFNHSVVNKVFGACGDLPVPLEGPILPYSLWQCGETQALTEAFHIMSFELSKPIETVRASVKVHISSSGLCHGIVLWIDWVLHPDIEERILTGPKGHQPTYWKQGVKLFRNPVPVEAFQSKDRLCNSNTFDLDAVFDSETGDLQIKVDFLNQVHPTGDTLVS